MLVMIINCLESRKAAAVNARGYGPKAVCGTIGRPVAVHVAPNSVNRARFRQSPYYLHCL